MIVMRVDRTVIRLACILVLLWAESSHSHSTMVYLMFEYRAMELFDVLEYIK